MKYFSDPRWPQRLTPYVVNTRCGSSSFLLSRILARNLSRNSEQKLLRLERESKKRSRKCQASSSPSGRISAAKGSPGRSAGFSAFHEARLFIGGSGAPGGIRTPDLLVRSQTLYPTELRAHVGQFTMCVSREKTADDRPAVGHRSCRNHGSAWSAKRPRPTALLQRQVPNGS